jgi:hypothetical protein
MWYNMVMGSDSNDVQLGLFVVSMAVTVFAYGAVVWSSLKPRSRVKKQ